MSAIASFAHGKYGLKQQYICSHHGIHVSHHPPQCLDMGAIVNETQRANIQKYVDLGVKEGADVFQIQVPRKFFIPHHAHTSLFRVVQSRIFILKTQKPCRKECGCVQVPEVPGTEQPCFYPPTLVSNVQVVHALTHAVLAC